MGICFEGIGQVVATFRTGDETLAAGMAVTMTGNGEVGLGKADDPLCGITVSAARGGAVAVQIGGVARAGRSDDDGKLETGWQKLACDGKGGVKTADETGGTKFLVLTADEKSAAVKL